LLFSPLLKSYLTFLQGLFPTKNKMEDGYDGVSPGNAFTAQNKYGNSN